MTQAGVTEAKTQGRGVEKEESPRQGRKTSKSTWDVLKMLSEKCFLFQMDNISSQFQGLS